MYLLFAFLQLRRATEESPNNSCEKEDSEIRLDLQDCREQDTDCTYNITYNNEDQFLDLQDVDHHHIRRNVKHGLAFKGEQELNNTQRGEEKGHKPFFEDELITKNGNTHSAKTEGLNKQSSEHFTRDTPELKTNDVKTCISKKKNTALGKTGRVNKSKKRPQHKRPQTTNQGLLGSLYESKNLKVCAHRFHEGIQETCEKPEAETKDHVNTHCQGAQIVKSGLLKNSFDIKYNLHNIISTSDTKCVHEKTVSDSGTTPNENRYSTVQSSFENLQNTKQAEFDIAEELQDCCSIPYCSRTTDPQESHCEITKNTSIHTLEWLAPNEDDSIDQSEKFCATERPSRQEENITYSKSTKVLALLTKEKLGIDCRQNDATTHNCAKRKRLNTVKHCKDSPIVITTEAWQDKKCAGIDSSCNETQNCSSFIQREAQTYFNTSVVGTKPPCAVAVTGIHSLSMPAVPLASENVCLDESVNHLGFFCTLNGKQLPPDLSKVKEEASTQTESFGSHIEAVSVDFKDESSLQSCFSVEEVNAIKSQVIFLDKTNHMLSLLEGSKRLQAAEKIININNDTISDNSNLPHNIVLQPKSLESTTVEVPILQINSECNVNTYNLKHSTAVNAPDRLSNSLFTYDEVHDQGQEEIICNNNLHLKEEQNLQELCLVKSARVYQSCLTSTAKDSLLASKLLDTQAQFPPKHTHENDQPLDVDLLHKPDTDTCETDNRAEAFLDRGKVRIIKEPHSSLIENDSTYDVHMSCSLKAKAASFKSCTLLVCGYENSDQTPSYPCECNLNHEGSEQTNSDCKNTFSCQNQKAVEQDLSSCKGLDWNHVDSLVSGLGEKELYCDFYQPQVENLGYFQQQVSIDNNSYLHSECRITNAEKNLNIVKKCQKDTEFCTGTNLTQSLHSGCRNFTHSVKCNNCNQSQTHTALYTDPVQKTDGDSLKTDFLVTRKILCQYDEEISHPAELTSDCTKKENSLTLPEVSTIHNNQKIYISSESLDFIPEREISLDRSILFKDEAFRSHKAEKEQLKSHEIKPAKLDQDMVEEASCERSLLLTPGKKKCFF